MQSCSFKKNREFHNSNISQNYIRLSFIIKWRYNIIKISAYVLTIIAQKNDYQVILFWPKNFEELKV